MKLDTPKYEDRYNVLSIEWRKEYIKSLYEPLKVRGDRDEIFRNYPRLKDESGNDTSLLNVSYSQDYYDGQIMSFGDDELGFYAIFRPQKGDLKGIKRFAEIEKTIEGLAILSKLQSDYSLIGKTLDELNEIERKIDELFNLLFSSRSKQPSLFQKNHYPQIFTNDLGYNLFLQLKEELGDNHSDMSFIYRKLVKDELIVLSVGDAIFRDFLDKHFQIIIDKTKTLSNCTNKHKETIYNLLKQRF